MNSKAADKKHAECRRLIEKAAKVLNASETGRTVKAELRTFLKGRVSNLDFMGWDAISALMQLYENGYPGSVLEALED